MKKLALIIVLAGWLVTFAFAKEIDITQSKGTDQSVIVSLTPKPAFMDTDQNVTLEAVFTIPIDETSVQKNNVKLKKITENKESMIDGEAAYNAPKNAVTFTPSTLLTHGYYEVEFKSLKPVKEHKEQQIKEIKYHFYVPEVINGYKLPPEPDKALNDSTLLGIDVNENGVRDDVERWIVISYKDKHPIYVDIAMQEARENKLILEHPEKAKEIHDEASKAVVCQGYYKYEAKYYGDPILIQEDAVDEYFRSKIYFNTKERMEAYEQYDTLLSGDSYTLIEGIEQKEACDFDTSKYEE